LNSRKSQKCSLKKKIENLKKTFDLAERKYNVLKNERIRLKGRRNYLQQLIDELE